jgi:hypothetical protein
MNMTNVKRAKMLANEFINAVNELQEQTAMIEPEKAERYPEYVENGVNSGLVRHWSVILSRQLAKMRREF